MLFALELVLLESLKMFDWWLQMNLGRDDTHNLRATIIIYNTWNLWKERCKRVFDNRARTAEQLLAAIRDDIQAVQLAWEE